MSNRKIKNMPTARVRYGQELPTANELLKRLKDANNCLDQQGSHGNWDANEYMFGMFNGMELILSIIEGREVKYRENPFRDQASTQRVPSAQELIEEFKNKIIGREDIFPQLLQGITESIMWKLSHDAELLSERTAVAKKRLEEAHMYLSKGLVSEEIKKIKF